MKIRSFVSGAALCLALGGVASAGFKQPWAVTIDTVNRTAIGSLGTARNSADGNQAIGCGVSYDSVNQKNNVNCTATDAAGHTAQCATQQAELIQIALGIHADSLLQFNWTGAECTNIIVVNSSIYAPKQP